MWAPNDFRVAHREIPATRARITRLVISVRFTICHTQLRNVISLQSRVTCLPDFAPPTRCSSLDENERSDGLVWRACRDDSPLKRDTVLEAV